MRLAIVILMPKAASADVHGVLRWRNEIFEPSQVSDGTHRAVRRRGHLSHSVGFQLMSRIPARVETHILSAYEMLRFGSKRDQSEHEGVQKALHWLDSQRRCARIQQSWEARVNV